MIRALTEKEPRLWKILPDLRPVVKPHANAHAGGVRLTARERLKDSGAGIRLTARRPTTNHVSTTRSTGKNSWRPVGAGVRTKKKKDVSVNGSTVKEYDRRYLLTIVLALRHAVLAAAPGKISLSIISTVAEMNTVKRSE